MKQIIKNLFQSDNFYAFLLGSLLTLAFAPFKAIPVVIISLSGFMLLHEKCTNFKQALNLGLAFGFGHYLTGMYWVANALLTDAEKFAWLVPVILVLFPTLFGLLTAAISAITHNFKIRTVRILIFASLWVGAELIRAHLLVGFPWNLLGYALNASDVLMQVFSIVGIYGASFIVAFIGTALYTRNIVTIVVALVLASSMWGFGNYRLANKSEDVVEGVTLRLVQPNLAEHHKGRRAMQEAALRRLAELSLMGDKDAVTHIIWPEAAFPFSIHDESRWVKALARFAPKDGALIFGTDRIKPIDGKSYKVYNSLFAVNDKGELLETYDKTHLVPFGEYVPFRAALPFIDKVAYGMMDFSVGEKANKSFKIPNLPGFLPLICFEVIFTEELWGDKDSDWLLNLTNDAWFGESTGPYQHFEMARARAVEYGKPLVRVANTGISGVINPYGEVVKKLKLGHTGFIDIELPKKVESTVYAIISRFIFILIAFALIGCVFIEKILRKR